MHVAAAVYEEMSNDWIDVSALSLLPVPTMRP